MKRVLVLLILALPLCLSAQNTKVREEVRADHQLASGPDRLYPFDAPKLTKRPRGYREAYVSVYARHGSRYAYTKKTYTFLRDAMNEAAENDNLTPYGDSLRNILEPFFNVAINRTGDLTRKGWQQHTRIAATMLKSFPKAFPRHAVIDACVSPSMRSAMSMTAFCLSLGQKRPDLKIYEHQSHDDIYATRPNHGNPLPAYKQICQPNPLTEDIEDFLIRKVDWKAILGRIFINPEAVVGDRSLFRSMDYLWMLVAGMNSLDDDIVPDVSGIFTADEFAAMWEVDNYHRFQEYYNYLGSCCSVWDDIVEKADARLASKSRGADLRFGHDHVIQTLLMIANIRDFGHFVDNTDELAMWYQTYYSPMATNLQLVFYTPRRKNKPVLVKLLLNGSESCFSGLEPVKGPYYNWDELKYFLAERTAGFCERIPIK
ncbi:MAG: hypothetical protein J5771_02680 [Bacteroidales bacterium]|nr:hypothetical protein [Bacteroidales bacterium]